MITDTHICAFFILYTSNNYNSTMLGVLFTTFITVSAYIYIYIYVALKELCVLYVDVTHDDARCQRVPRPRASNAACAAEVYNDHITDCEVTLHRGIPSSRGIA